MQPDGPELNFEPQKAHASFLELGALSYQLEGAKGLSARFLKNIGDGSVSVHHAEEQERIDRILRLTTQYFGRGLALLNADVTSPADPFLKIFSASCDSLKDRPSI